MTTSAGWQSRLFPLITPHCFTFRENGKALPRWLHDREDGALVKMKKNQAELGPFARLPAVLMWFHVASLSLCVSLCVFLSP